MPTKSHITQVMQNYLDYTDVRSRQNATSIEGQLLNMAAIELEDLNLRAFRESSQTLITVPTNIDNGGIYYGGQVPQSLIPTDIPPTFSNVIGINGSSYTTLVPYVDTLPVPTRIELNSAEAVALDDPILFTNIGSGNTQLLVWTVQYAYPGAFPVPNVLTVWVDQLSTYQSNVTLTIVGEIYPQPAWVAERKSTTEVITISGEGIAVTQNRWSVISQIAIRGLPIGARIRGWSLPFNLPAAPDFARPFSTPQDRLLTFDRYWQIDNENGLLNEMYEYGGFTGLVIYTPYLINDVLQDVAVEPNTYGIYAASETTLYYADRREVMPSCVGTGLTTEPLFGLQIALDITQTGPTRYVVLSGVAYANASAIFQYRYTVNGTNCILPDGALGPITGGWRVGAPQPVSVPLLQEGDYTFQLQMQDGNGVTTFDVVPWHNATFTPLASIDLTSIIDTVVGLTFDSYGTLWIWNGTFAIPVILHYDAYVYDSLSQSIFMTDPYAGLQVTD
jgi:hypothetical protein